MVEKRKQNFSAEVLDVANHEGNLVVNLELLYSEEPDLVLEDLSDLLVIHLLLLH